MRTKDNRKTVNVREPSSDQAIIFISNSKWPYKFKRKILDKWKERIMQQDMIYANKMYRSSSFAQTIIKYVRLPFQVIRLTLELFSLIFMYRNISYLFVV